MADRDDDVSFEAWGEDEWGDFLWGRESAPHLDYSLLNDADHDDASVADASVAYDDAAFAPAVAATAAADAPAGRTGPPKLRIHQNFEGSERRENRWEVWLLG
jgi:hypothetical protein